MVEQYLQGWFGDRKNNRDAGLATYARNPEWEAQLDEYDEQLVQWLNGSELPLTPSTTPTSAELPTPTSEFNDGPGIFTVTAGAIAVDIAFDGRDFPFELGLVNLRGMGALVNDPVAFIEEVVARIHSQSDLGYLLHSDALNLPQFGMSSAVPQDTPKLAVGEQFTLVMTEQGRIANLQERPDIQLIFAFAPEVLGDITGTGQVLSLATSHDHQRDNLILTVEGATTTTAAIENLLPYGEIWQETVWGEAMSTQLPVTRWQLPTQGEAVKFGESGRRDNPELATSEDHSVLETQGELSDGVDVLTDIVELIQQATPARPVDEPSSPSSQVAHQQVEGAIADSPDSPAETDQSPEPPDAEEPLGSNEVASQPEPSEAAATNTSNNTITQEDQEATDPTPKPSEAGDEREDGEVSSQSAQPDVFDSNFNNTETQEFKDSESTNSEPLTLNSELPNGVFTVGASGDVSFDYIYDGGAFKFELGIFSLEGMDLSQSHTAEFQAEAVRRVLSQSEQGEIVIRDRTQGAKYNGQLRDNFNHGEYTGPTHLKLEPGQQFAVLLSPRSTFRQIQKGRGKAAPIFSFDQPAMVDITGKGHTFGFEDLDPNGKKYDGDFNDAIFTIRGATTTAPTLAESNQTWWDHKPQAQEFFELLDQGSEVTTYSDRFLNPSENFSLIGRADSPELVEKVEIWVRNRHSGDWEIVQEITDFDEAGRFKFEQDGRLPAGNYKVKTVTQYQSGLNEISEAKDFTVLSLSNGEELSDRVKTSLARSIQLGSYNSEQLAQTTDWLISIRAGQDVAALEEKLGVELVATDSVIPNLYRAEFSKSLSASDIESRLEQIAAIEYAFPLVDERVYWHGPNNTHSRQWHLDQSGIKTAWNDHGVSGQGVTIGFVDDGFETNHLDLDTGYQSHLSYDFDQSDNNPDPYFHDTLQIEQDDYDPEPFLISDVVIPSSITPHYINYYPIRSDLAGTVDSLTINFEIEHESLSKPLKLFLNRHDFGEDYLNHADDRILIEPTSGTWNVGTGTYSIDLSGVQGWSARGRWGLGIVDTQQDDGKSGLLKSFSLNMTTLNRHGTAVAGIGAGAGESNLGITGAAYDAQWAGIRAGVNGLAADKAEDALTHGASDIDLYSNSWGLGLLVNSPLAIAAIEQAAKGQNKTYVFSGGNAREFAGSTPGATGNNVNYSVFANSPHTIAVAAVDETGKVAEYVDPDTQDIIPYSAPGASLLISAYSSGSSRGITTADVLTQGGERSNFGGTSAAAPFVSGVIALMLEANPNLGWRDIQHILIQSADRGAINDPNADWSGSAGDLIRHSHDYGFGLVDPAQAVAIAKAPDWQPVQAEATPLEFAQIADEFLLDHVTVSSDITVADELDIESVEVLFNANHGYLGDLEIVLVHESETGEITRSILAEQHDGYRANQKYQNDNDKYLWTFSSLRHWGDSSKGKWSLEVTDRKTGNLPGTWTHWELKINGTDPTLNTPPVLNVPQPLTYTEDQPLTLTDIVVTDANNDNLSVLITVPSGVGVLTGGGETSEAAGVWEFNGTPAEVEAALQDLQFTPADDFNGTVQLQISANDGRIAVPVTDVIELNGIAVNDAPRLSDGLLTGLTLNQPFTISYQDLVDLTGAVDVEGDDITFTIDGTITQNGQPVTGTLELAAGQTFEWTPGVVGNDIAAFTVIASDGQDNALPVSITAAVTELPPATVTLTPGAVDASEDGAEGSFTIARLGGDISQPLVVNYTLSGTAENGQDYDLPGSVTLAAGESSTFITVQPTDDLVYEGTETLIVELAPGVGYIPNSTLTSHTINIADNDPEPPSAEVTLQALDQLASEDGDAAVFYVERDGDTSQDLTVNYAISGEVDGNDLPLTGSVVIAAGETRAIFGVSAFYDTDFTESNESFVVSLTNGTGYEVGSQASSSATIANSTRQWNYGPFVHINPANGHQYVVGEIDSWYGSHEQAKALGGNLIVIDNPDENSWLAQTFPDKRFWLGVTDSEIYGASEGNFQAANGDALGFTNWGLGEPNNSGGHEDFAEFTTAESNNGSQQTRQPYTFRPGDSLWTIAQRYLGTGFRWGEIQKADGSSYADGTQYTIPVGTVVYIPTGSTPIVERGLWNDVVGEARFSTTGIIEIDPDQLAKPIVNVKVTDYGADEDGNSGQVIFTRVGDISQALTVEYTVGGSATSGSDFQTLSGSVTFAADQLIATVGINPLGDFEADGLEDVVITLKDTGTYDLGLHRTGQVWIEELHPINQIARDAIGRDVSLFSVWEARFNAGESLDVLRRDIIASAVDGNGNLDVDARINEAYLKAFGSPASPTDIADWRSRIADGTTLSEMSQELADISSANFIDAPNPVYFNSDTGNYYFLTAQDTWLGAQEQAVSFGGNLVTIDDANEQQWVLDTFSSTGVFWIGLTDSEVLGQTEGNFAWVDGGSSTYRRWYNSNEPSDDQRFVGGEDFVNQFHAGTDRWNDESLAHENGAYRGTYGLVEVSAAALTSEPEPLSTEKDVLINTYTPDNQDAARVTALQDGGFVVTWDSQNQDGNGDGIYGKRYNAEGVPITDEFLINDIPHDQTASDVTALPDGGFLVVWSSPDHPQSNDHKGVYGQRFNSDGSKNGDEFPINTTTFQMQIGAKVTTLADGSYIVTWQSFEQLGSERDFIPLDEEIIGRRFTTDGQPPSEEFIINTTTLRDQEWPDITPLHDGGFVVTWQSDRGGSSGYQILAQRFNASNQPEGDEIQVPMPAQGSHIVPSVAGLENGGFIIAWWFQEDGNAEVFAQRYGADGQAEGDAFLVNTDTLGAQNDPTVVSLEDGGFLVAWASNDNGGVVRAQRYDGYGDRIGEEFSISEAGYFQRGPELARLDNGNVIATWQGEKPVNGATDATWEVFGRIVEFDPVNVAPRLSAATFDSAVQDQAKTISYEDLLTASSATDANGDPISFQIEELQSGSLTLNGQPVTAGETLVQPGDELQWVPDAAGDGLVGFTVSATDGIATSAAAIPVSFDVIPALTGDVTVTVHRIKEFDTLDIDIPFFSENRADFRATVAIDGQRTVSPIWNEQDDVSPNWQAVQNVSGSIIPISIQIDDEDGGLQNDFEPVDVSPGAGYVLNLSYNLETGEITGPGVNGQAGEQIYVRGTGSSNDADLWFSINFAPPNTPPTLTQIDTFTSATVGQSLALTGADLLNASDAADVDGDVVSLAIDAVDSGTLTVNGATAQPGTVITADSQLVWVPDTAGATVAGFTVKATDGRDESELPVAVTFDVAEPVLATGDVTVTVHRITELGSIDFSGDPDFRATININGDVWRSPVWQSNPDISPDWQSTQQVTGTQIPISIKIEDETVIDLGFLGDITDWTDVDVTPVSGDTLTLTYDLLTGEITGSGVNGFAGQEITVQGTGSDRAILRFSVDFTPENTPPELTQVDTFTGATQFEAQTITYADLLAASDATDVDGDEISFRIEGAGFGDLQLNGQSITVLPTLVSAGDELQWTPDVAGDNVFGFKVSATDGQAFSSNTVDVNFNVGANDSSTGGGVTSIFVIDTDTYTPNTNYLSIDDSPFQSEGLNFLYVEDFEDGLLNNHGLKDISGVEIISGGLASDNLLNGGTALQVNGSQLTIEFDSSEIRPTHVGLVVTDFDMGGTIEISSGSVSTTHTFSNSLDQFLGISNTLGISSVTLTADDPDGWQVDHIQYG